MNTVTDIINLSPFDYKGFNEPLERVRELWSFKYHPTVEDIWSRAEELSRIIQDVYPSENGFLISGHPFMVGVITQLLLEMDVEPIYPYMFKGQLTGIIRPWSSEGEKE